MNEEEKLKQEIDLMSFGNISVANLSTCETYGLSGICGSKCPKFKDKTCEVHDEVLEKENTDLKQALKEIRKYINNNSSYYATDTKEVYFVIEETKEETFCSDILQIIDKVLGDDKR